MKFLNEIYYSLNSLIRIQLSVIYNRKYSLNKVMMVDIHLKSF